ncbi:unnamed protein product [Lymnaea stagnalis]|uniref:RRM domain-containing protein n=1 Tax=Lymnaea stagnalis TaxID=6523 RepID=A0AAV2I9H9_LYMST
MGKKGGKKQKTEVAAPKGKKAPPAKVAEADSDDDSSEEEEVQTKVVQKKAVPVKVVKKAESDSEDSEEEMEEDSEEEVKQPKKAVAPAKKAVKQPKAVPAKKAVKISKESSSEDDSSEEESSGEELISAAKKTIATKTLKKAVVAKKEDSDDDDDDDDDEEDDEEEEEKPAKKVKGNSNGKKAKESDDDEDDSEEEAAVKEAESNKRKKDSKNKKDKSAKKPKLDASNGDAAVTLFVGNLDKDTTEDAISNFFAENDVKVAEVRKIPNKNKAFVDLESSDDVDSALALSGSTLDESAITIEKAKPRVQKEQAANKSFGSPSTFGGDDNDRDARTLFVKNLPEDATPDSLRTIFDTAADIRIPQKDGYHKGFAFVEFADAETMEKAKAEKDGADLDGRSLFLDYMGAKSSLKKQRGGAGGRGGDRRGRGGFGDGGRQQNSGLRGESKVLFVKNLSYDTDESSLTAAFEGAVSARIPTFPDSGKPKGFAFVDFNSADAAAEAFDSMNGQAIDGRQVTLDFAADKGSGGGGRDFSPRGGRGGRGFGGGGRGFGGGGRGFGGDRGRGGRGRGGDRGRGGRGGFNKARGGIVKGEGKKMTFDDSD